MGVISVLRAGVRGCGCFCAAIGSGWAVRGDAGNCGYGCRPVCGWAWSLLLLLSCVAFWGGRCAFFGEIARKNRKSQRKPNFRRKSGRIGAEMRCGGRVVARRDGKSWAPSLFCAQVCTTAIFAFALRLGVGGAVRGAIFSEKSREKEENLSESRIFGGIGAEMRRGRLGDSTEVWEIAGAAVVLYVGGHGRCFCF